MKRVIDHAMPVASAITYIILFLSVLLQSLADIALNDGKNGTNLTDETNTTKCAFGRLASHYDDTPDSCVTTYDAISMIRNELFIFRGRFVWRFGSNGLYHGYPTKARRLWISLPDNFTKIDAVYENQEKKIVFFIERYYYMFDSITLDRNYPQLLTNMGLPESLTHIDAAFTWGYNNRTYLFSGTLYWKIDDGTGRVEQYYPRSMTIWQGIGFNIDAAFRNIDGKSYFFKGVGYWEFDDAQRRVAHAKPKLSSQKWMACVPRMNEINTEET